MELKKVCPQFKGSLVTEITEETRWMWDMINCHYAGKGYRRLEFIVFMGIQIRRETTCLYKKKTGSICVEQWRTLVYYLVYGSVSSEIMTNFEAAIVRAIAVKSDVLSKDVATAVEASMLRKQAEELKKNKDIVVPHD